ncbi:MAG: glycerol-3-phosphate acyltransferase [Anaerolineales bacterium]|jgi:glycerol-3-phosphate acyltransferase PlsY|nr:glycerol-3-phosphate acyltransferase [Anaerolineales bacterium]HJO33344.1 glycerol-3-phosphate acyltransferase [Anaerolineales bacterium]
MNQIIAILMVALGYVIGAVPVGLLIVKRMTGKDIRMVGSGRSGATNVIRAAGLGAGFTTALLDLVKGALPIWLVKLALPAWPWAHVLAGVAAVLGHNYSIFLRETVTDAQTGRTRTLLRGGAGGVTTVGGAIGLWAWTGAILVPTGIAILFGIGYASVATMSGGILTTTIMAVRASQGLAPTAYVYYGLSCFALQLWALRPNIKRLLNGTERLVGWRAKRLSGKLTADPTALNRE